MAPTIAERFRGINGDSRQRVIQYVVEGAMSDQDALNLAEVATPLTYDFMPRATIRVKEVDKKAYSLRAYDDGGSYVGNIEEQDLTVDDGTYYVEALYNRNVNASDTVPENSGDNWATFSFQQSLETARIRQARATTVYNTNPGAPTEPAVPATNYIPFEGINANADNEYEGADIRLPIGSFGFDFTLSQGAINSNYLKAVQNAVGKVNSTAFWIHNAGEVLFVSASGQKRANLDDWEFRYRFEVRENTDIEITGGSNPIKYSKQGHDYLWAYYQEEKQTVGSVTAPVPTIVQMNVEEVYERIDLWATLFTNLQP